MNALAALLTAIVGAIIGSSQQPKVNFWQTPEGHKRHDEIHREIDREQGLPPGSSKAYYESWSNI